MLTPLLPFPASESGCKLDGLYAYHLCLLNARLSMPLLYCILPRK